MCTFGINRQPPGLALVIVMLLMTVLLMAGTTFLTISSTESQIALNDQASVRASLLAEAAIHKALVQLNADPGYAGEEHTALGGGSFSVSVVPAAQQMCPGTSGKDLTATAVVPVREGNVQARIEVVVDRVAYPFRWGAYAAVPNEYVASHWRCRVCGVIFGRDREMSELWLDDHTWVDSFDSGAGPYDADTNHGQSGNIGGHGDVRIDHGGTVGGNVRAGGEFVRGAGVDVAGTVTTGVSPHRDSLGESFPSPTVPGDASGDLNVRRGTTTLEAGTHVYRDMTFGDGASLTTSGPVEIYVTGTVSIGDNVTLGSHPASQLRIVMKSDGDPHDPARFEAGSGFTMYGSLYAKDADVKLGTGAQVFGSIIGRTVYVQNRGQIHYDQAMSSQEICHGGKLTIRRGTWREVMPSG
jgi:hypothetical protein